MNEGVDEFGEEVFTYLKNWGLTQIWKTINQKATSDT